MSADGSMKCVKPGCEVTLVLEDERGPFSSVTVNGKRYVPEQPAPSPAPKPTRGEEVARNLVRLDGNSVNGEPTFRIQFGKDVSYIFGPKVDHYGTEKRRDDTRRIIAAAIDAERAATRDEIAAYLDSIHYADAGNFVRTMKLD